MFNLPTAEDLKAMEVDAIQKFLDALKADEMTFLDYFKALADGRKLVITLEPKGPSTP